MGKISIAGTRYINYNRSAYYDEGVKRSLDASDRDRGALPLDGCALYRCGDLLPEQPAGCGKELRTCIHYRYRHDVFGGNACGRAPLREEVRASAQG